MTTGGIILQYVNKCLHKCLLIYIKVILVVKESLKKQRTVKLHVNSVQHGHFGHHGHLVQSPVASEFKIRHGSFLFII